jgi:hypothetical protein
MKQYKGLSSASLLVKEQRRADPRNTTGICWQDHTHTHPPTYIPTDLLIYIPSTQIPASMFTYRPIYFPPIYSSTHLTLSLPIYLFTYYPSTCLHTYLSIHLCVYPSVFSVIRMYVCLFLNMHLTQRSSDERACFVFGTFLFKSRPGDRISCLRYL